MTQTAVSAHPPACHDQRAERPDRVAKLLERLAHGMSGRLGALFVGRNMRSIVAHVEALSGHFAECSEAQLREESLEISQQLHKIGFTPQLVARSFALIREVATRTLAQRHYGSQLIGGQALLHGMAIEMETGEGKTLTATLTAATVAMAGIPVHVISVNDYLTERDAETMGPLYQSLGLSVGCVVHGMSPQQRRAAYGCQITYVTNKEIVFDYLRDRLTLGSRIDPLRLQAENLYAQDARSKKLLLRGLHFALVDEADSILIDEARTPLIISGASGGEQEQEFLIQALNIAQSLQKEEDYILEISRRQIRLTKQGRQNIAAQSDSLGAAWCGIVRREAVVTQALTALQLFQRDEHYLVRDGKVEIVDEFTGRVMADRSWEQGLHQLIELKEGCELTQQRDPLAKISYQRFFRRYLRLCGMTGTAKEVASELWSVYHLPTLRIPTHRPVIRKKLPDRVLPTLELKWQFVVARIKEIQTLGRPILVGTRSVAASEHLSRLVSAAGLEHQVLNARQDSDEAGIISRSGQLGRITIATNMAGRGTDIKLGPGVKDLGGLHVIATERHEAARIDRQLAGRGGRQGDPGTFEAILSLQDPLLETGHKSLSALIFRRLSFLPAALYLRGSRLAINQAQQHIERYHAQLRKELFRQDQQQGSLLSFSGRLE